MIGAAHPAEHAIPARRSRSSGTVPRMTTLLLGQTLAFTADPFSAPWGDCVSHHERGGVLIVGGRIAAVGDGAALRAANPGARVVDLGDATLLPGFMDAHTHVTGEPGEDWKQDVIDELQRMRRELFAALREELELDEERAEGFDAGELARH